MARLLKLQLPEIYGSPPSPPTAWSTRSFALSTPPTPSIAYPPIYLSPSSDAFTPSPSPLPALSSSPHRSLSTASVVGVSVAAVVTLALASTVLSTAAGKVGASCLLTPALNVLSSLFCSKSVLCSNCPHWNSKKDNFDDDGGGGSTGYGTEDLIEIDLYKASGDPILGEAGSEAAAAAESIATGTLQDAVKGDFGRYSAQALISTSMSKFAASEMRKLESIIIEPVNEIVREVEPFLSTSCIGDFAASEAKKQGTAMIDEAVRGDERIISTRANNILSKYAATELKKHEVMMMNEAARVNDAMSRYAATESKKHDFITDEVFEAYQRPPTSSESMITYAATDRSRKQDLTTAGGLMETVSERSVQEKGGISEREIETKGSGGDGTGKSSASAVAPGGKGNTSGGGEARTRTGAGIIAAGPAKTMQATTSKPTLLHDGNAPRAMEHVVSVANNKARRNPANLGHVSLSCEISTHRLRFFAFCSSGGTYGSAPPS